MSRKKKRHITDHAGLLALQSGIIISPALRRTKISRFEPNISNFIDSSIQKTFLKSSSIQPVGKGKLHLLLFSGLSSGFWMATRLNNLVSLSRLFTIVNDTGLDGDFFTSARISGAVMRLFHLLVTTMYLSSLAVELAFLIANDHDHC